MDADGRALAQGAGAGLVATGTMSAEMLIGRWSGLLGEAPPHRIADRTLAALGRPPGPGTSPVRGGLTAVGHFGFGAAIGALFALSQHRAPVPLAPVPRGLLVATLVWFVSYQGWVPALGLLPPIHRDRPGRTATMLVAHWIYGATLGLCLRRR